MKTAWVVMALWMLITHVAFATTWDIREQPDRLVIKSSQRPVAEFVFRDPRILRPYFANVHTPNGLQVTRHHPPKDGDAKDHDTMHPGLWLAFGDVNGNDFWRNKARIEHGRFVRTPRVVENQLEFATESRLLTAENQPLGRFTNAISWTSVGAGWLLVWDATIHADDADLLFGDQEEMGFGARLATPLMEKHGGRITNSRGLTTAAKTWGQSAVWCDYSGHAGDAAGGILLVPSPANFRESWWHNRDYGLMVANPFGRAAMKQGDRSIVTVRRGEELRLRFAAWIHDGVEVDADDTETVLKLVK